MATEDTPASDTPTIVLASASPRRAELLAQLGVAFRVVSFAVDEQRQPDEAPHAYIERIVECKRAYAAALLASTAAVFLCADTVVHLGGVILDKPQSAIEARAHLARIQGCTHEVSTRFCISAPRGVHAKTVTSTVRVQPMTPGQMDAYVASREGADKAGGYAIQGGFARHVAHLDGSYSAVMGLPLFELAAALRDLALVPRDF